MCAGLNREQSNKPRSKVKVEFMEKLRGLMVRGVNKTTLTGNLISDFTMIYCDLQLIVEFCVVDSGMTPDPVSVYNPERPVQVQ